MLVPQATRISQTPILEWLEETSMSKDGFTSASRVRRRSEFQRAYSGGVRIHGRFMTVFLVANGASICRLGVAATRKLGSAVVRNRAKRLAREVFRRHKLSSGVDVIVVPRREMIDAPFNSIETDYLTAIERGRRPGDRARGSGVSPARRNRRL